MSLFFNSKKFYKPGPGVEKDEPKKRAPVRFFELYFRKFWKYLEINLIYFVCMLPIILFVYGFVYANAFEGLDAAGIGLEDIYTFLLHFMMLYYQYVPAPIIWILIAVSAIIYGPMKVGVTYVLRNFSLEKHAWLSDMFDKAKENFKQGLFFGILDILVYVVLFYNLVVAQGSGMVVVARYVSVLFFVIYGFMRRYIYQMIVTVELSVFDIFKNAFLFAFIGIFRNVGVSLVNLALWVGTVVLIVTFSMVELPILCCLIFSFTMFLGVFATYPMVQKYLVEPILAQQAADGTQAGENQIEENSESEN